MSGNDRRLVACGYCWTYGEHTAECIERRDTFPNHRPLREAIGLPDLAVVAEDNNHGTNWQLEIAADQGEDAPDIDRYYVQYGSTEGYRADYFYVAGSWSLGAN